MYFEYSVTTSTDKHLSHHLSAWSPWKLHETNLLATWGQQSNLNVCHIITWQCCYHKNIGEKMCVCAHPADRKQTFKSNIVFSACEKAD